MERIHRTGSTGIILTMLLLCQIVACGVKQPDNETVYEEIIASGYSSFDGKINYERDRHRFLATLLAHNNSDYKNVYYWFSARNYGYNDIADTGYLDKIYRNESYSRKYGIELRKDTLGAFHYRAWQIDLNIEPGRKFYSDPDLPPEEQFDPDWYIMLKSKIYDTVFNDILHVKQCFRYTYEDCAVTWYESDSKIRWDIYYDFDRCMFVHAEAWNLDMNKLIYIHRVERVNKIDSIYFNKTWNSGIMRDTILEPLIAPTNYL